MHNVYAIACAAAIIFGAQETRAQQYPAKTIRLIMPYPPGGSTDIVGRLMAERLTMALGQIVLVDNKPGASAQIGTELAAKAPADGYTLLMGTSTNAINHALNPKLPYDFPGEFQPIALVAKAGQVLIVHPSLPARTVREFISLAKARPGHLTYASSGSGTSGHLAMEAFAIEAKIKLVHIPYKGNAPALNDLLGGQVVSGFSNVVSALPHVSQGRLRALGISSAKRSALAPDVPTIAELGYADFDVTAWFGIMARAGVPGAVITRLNQECVQILKSKEVQDKLLGFGLDPAAIYTTKEFADFLQADIKRWANLARDANLKE
ncbi:MAG: tripartite tricarboxylate transporter substrate binding protein [Proteobacteria bacterium]|nr:tripartite tricarboxylate transporter substrate binding protein [Pseudomonadota bacterium]